MLTIWGNQETERPMTWPGNAFPSGPGNPGGPLSGLWLATGGRQGKEPPPRIRQVMAMWLPARSVPAEEQVKLGRAIWQTLVEDLWVIGTVGLAPSAMGVRIVKTTLGNVPQRQVVSVDGQTSANSHPETVFFR